MTDFSLTFAKIPISWGDLQFHSHFFHGSLRKRDSEAAADAISRLESKAPAIHFDGPFCNGQPETGTAAILAGTRFVSAIETIEDARMHLVGNAGARVR